jgi:hypothetical protein
MKLLLDECTPHVLKRFLTGFEITRCRTWVGPALKWGVTQRAEGHFDVHTSVAENGHFEISRGFLVYR